MWDFIRDEFWLLLPIFALFLAVVGMVLRAIGVFPVRLRRLGAQTTSTIRWSPSTHINLTEQEKETFTRWVIQEVDERIVPEESWGDGLKFNLVHLIAGDGELYNYQPEQDAEIEGWTR